MRRSRSSPPISSKQLKHFAVAAGAITFLLAIFASGEDWGAKAQIEAVEAKNRMVEAERQKSGTKTVLTSIAVRKPTDSGGFGEAPGPAVAAQGNEVGGGTATAPPISSSAGGSLPAQSGPPPTGPKTHNGVPIYAAPPSGTKPPSQRQAGPLSVEEARRVREASRQRSGSNY